jgi:hypothetical protein
VNGGRSWVAHGRTRAVLGELRTHSLQHLVSSAPRTAGAHPHVSRPERQPGLREDDVNPRPHAVAERPRTPVPPPSLSGPSSFHTCPSFSTVGRPWRGSASYSPVLTASRPPATRSRKLLVGDEARGAQRAAGYGPCVSPILRHTRSSHAGRRRARTVQMYAGSIRLFGAVVRRGEGERQQGRGGCVWASARDNR